MNRVGKYCSGLLEVAWLSVLIITPLYITLNGNSSNPDKVALLRSIVLFSLGVWGCKWLAEKKKSSRAISPLTRLLELLRAPLGLPLVSLIIAYLISTLFSLSPVVSLWGYYERYEGIYTIFSYIVLFFIIVGNLQKREQIQRMIAVIAVVSYAVDTYAILQHFGMDPLEWNLSYGTRVVTTIGNPIFTAAFLTMTFFLLIGQAILAAKSFFDSQKSLPGELLRAVIYGLIALLNLVAMWFTSSRGPFLGLLVGSFFFLFIILLYLGQRRFMISFLAAAVLVLGLLGLLSVPGMPFSAQAKPVVGKIGNLFQSQEGTGRIRVLIWEGVARVALPHTALVDSNGNPDKWNLIRPLVGYGADSLGQSMESFYNPELYKLDALQPLYDRAHNEFWNTWAFFGIFGVLAEYFLFLSVFSWGLKWLGLISTTSEGKLFWYLSASGGIFGGLLCWLFFGLNYLGLGMPIGLLVSPFGILVYRLFRPAISETCRLDFWQRMILLCLLSAAISNYVEILFGITVATTSVLVWSFYALILVIGRAAPEKSNEISDGEISSDKGPINFEVELIFGIRLKQILFSVGFLVLLSFILISDFMVLSQVGSGASATLWNTLTIYQGTSPHVSYGLLGLLVGVLLLSATLVQLEFDGSSGEIPHFPTILMATGVAVVLSAFILLVRSQQLVDAQTAFSSGDWVSYVAIYTGLLTSVYVIVFLLLLLWGYSLTDYQNIRKSNFHPAPLEIFGFIFFPLGALLLIAWFNLLPMQAATTYTRVRTWNGGGDYRTVLGVYDQLIQNMPADPYYLSTAYDIYGKGIGLAKDASSKEQMSLAEMQYVQKAYQLMPFSINMTMAMARMYRQAGDITDDPVIKSIQFSTAEKYYAAALKVKPGRVDYWLEWAEDRALAGDVQGAREKVQTAINTDPTYIPSYTFIGDLDLAVINQSGSLVDNTLLTEAIKAYQTSVDLSIKAEDNPANFLINLSDAYLAGKQYENALQVLVKAASLQAADKQMQPNEWVTYTKLASVAAAMNETASQRNYLQTAIQLAPQSQVKALQAQLENLHH